MSPTLSAGDGELRALRLPGACDCRATPEAGDVAHRNRRALFPVALSYHDHRGFAAVEEQG